MASLINKILFVSGIATTIGIGNLKAQDTIYNLGGNINKVIIKDDSGVLITNFKDGKRISWEAFNYDYNGKKLISYTNYESDSIGRIIIKKDKEGAGHFNEIIREDLEKNLTEIDLNADKIYDQLHPGAIYQKRSTNYSPETQKQILTDFKNFIKEKGRQATGLYGKPIYSYKTNNAAEKKAKFSATLEANNIKNIETFIVSKENNPNDSLKTFSTKHTFIDYGTNGLKTKEDEYNWVDNRVKPKEDSRFLEFTSLPKDRQTHATFTYFDLLVEMMKDAGWGEY